MIQSCLIIMSSCIGLFETCESSRNFEYIAGGLVRPKAVLNTLTSSCFCPCTNCASVSPDDHCLRGKICGEFYSRSWRAVFGELTFQMFALVFTTVTWLNASFSCAREAVVWKIVCLPSWTKVRSCLLDVLKRTQRDLENFCVTTEFLRKFIKAQDLFLAN